MNPEKKHSNEEIRRFRRERSNPSLLNLVKKYPTFNRTYYTSTKKELRFYQKFKLKPSKNYCAMYQTPS